MPIDENLVKKMSRLLEGGNTLLNEYCPSCGYPLFFIKSNGMKYCAKCDVNYVSEEDMKKIAEKVPKERMPQESEITKMATSGSDEKAKIAKSYFIAKIFDIMSEIAEEILPSIGNGDKNKLELILSTLRALSLVVKRVGG